MRRRLLVSGLVAGLGLLALAAALVRGPGPEAASAASHREAPLISMDPTADITDFFMFRSYEPGQDDKVVLIMDVIPGEEPSSGPNYWNFDPNVLYSFHIDNNKDGRDDVTFNFRFRNEPIRGTVRTLNLPLSFVAVPPITSLDGPGSAGIGLRQRYSVEMVGDRRRGDVIATDRIVVPSNVGPRTTPNYPALAAQGIYSLGGGVKVFAGQRDDPFYIDLGGVFDTLNLRRMLPIESNLEDASDTTNPFGVDMLGGFNVHEIALQVPASWLTVDHKSIAETSQPVLGGYASTSRPKVTVLGKHDLVPNDDEGEDGFGFRHGRHRFVQIQRLANPLINEVIIGTQDKDLWNRTEPEDEGQFLDYYLNPRLATALQLVTGVPAATMGRNDLVNLLLKYSPGDTQLSELLRLNLSVPPTPLANQKRLTVLAGDNAGWPNGRRPKDDVTDIAVRVVGGPNYIAAHAADGVNTNDRALSAEFPFLATPWDGRSSNHPHA
jgi:Domain of unknown function (DUF4331)